MILSDAHLREIARLVGERLGLEFPPARWPELERGIRRAWALHRPPSATAFLERLASAAPDAHEWQALATHLTVGETYFFRDPACLEALTGQVLPRLIADRRQSGLLRLRLWSAGCASGEEPYTLAIFLDRLLPDRERWAITLLATDINPAALAAARRGRYRSWALRQTPEAIRERYFREHGPEDYELDPAIRRAVTFAPLNLAAEGYPAVESNTTAMDLVLCRNALMYFGGPVQAAAARRLGRALISGGWLVPSPAEAVADLFRPLAPINFPGAVFFRKVRAADAPRPSAMGEQGSAGWGAGGRGRGPGNGAVEAGDRAARAGVGPDPSAAGQAAALPHPPVPSPHPPTPPPLLAQARTLADAGELEAAWAACREATRQAPLEVRGHLLAAAICQERDDPREALAALRRAIYLDPDSALGHFLLGSLLFRRGRLDQAGRQMGIVLRLLEGVPDRATVSGSEEWTAGTLREAAGAYLADGPPGGRLRTGGA